MKTPVILVALALTAAILVAASLLILAEMRQSSRTSALNISVPVFAGRAPAIDQRGDRPV